MKRLLFALIFLISACVPEQLRMAMVARSGADSVTLFDEPCPANALLEGYRAGAMIYDGKFYSACWRVHGDRVMIIDSAGDISAIPILAFRVDEGT